jgi:hypothetical protein
VPLIPSPDALHTFSMSMAYHFKIHFNVIRPSACTSPWPPVLTTVTMPRAVTMAAVSDRSLPAVFTQCFALPETSATSFLTSQ